MSNKTDKSKNVNKVVCYFCKELVTEHQHPKVSGICHSCWEIECGGAVGEEPKPLRTKWGVAIR